MIVRLSADETALPEKSVFMTNRWIPISVVLISAESVCFRADRKNKPDSSIIFRRSAQTPILFSIDAENGLGMRMDSVGAAAATDDAWGDT